jgi:uroporphyrin-3 C-methyltransferase
VTDPSPAPLVVASPPTPPTPAPAARPAWLLAVVLALIAVAALALAWDTRSRLRAMEQELVRRQQDSQAQAAEARVLARQAEDAARQAAAKVALVEARVADATVQRSQVEELLDSLTRSHDDGVLGEVEALLRSAQQQAAITGSAEPLVTALRHADERLAKRSEPQLERVRRAVGRDLERLAKSAGAADLGALVLRIDEALRQVDDLPLLAAPRAGAAPDPAPAQPAAPPGPDASWRDRVGAWWARTRSEVWNEVRGLVRVTRVDAPEAALLAPEQAMFLRENLKLRLLNARLALLARQFDAAQNDLRAAQAMLDRYYDRDVRRVAATSESLRQTAQLARAVTLPRPDETLAALAAAGR